MLLFGTLCAIGVSGGIIWYASHVHDEHTALLNKLHTRKPTPQLPSINYNDQLKLFVKHSKSDINKNHYHDALHNLFKARKLAPHDAEINNMIGVAYSDDQQYDQAIKYYHKAIRLNPKNSFYYSNLGDAYYSNNDSESALLAFNEARHLNKNDSDNFYGLGRIYDDMQKYPNAIKALTRAVHLHQQGFKGSVNSLSDCYKELGVAYYYNNQYTKSLNVLHQANDLSSFDYSVIGSDYFSCNKFRHSLRAIRIAIKLDSHNDSAFSVAGCLYEKAHRYKSAVKMFLIAHRLDPSYVYYCTDACQAWYYDGNLAKSKSLTKFFINEFNGSSNVSYLYDNLGFIAISDGSNDQGAMYYRKAININPHDALAYDYLGDLYAHQNDSSKAMSDYRSAIASDPSSDQYYADLGNLYFKQHMYESAITEYQLALSYSNINNLNFDPNHMMYALFETKQSKAMNTLFNKLNHNYWSSDSYKLIGRNYYNAYDYRDAVPFYRQATLLNNTDDEAFSDLGEACHKLGKNNLAIKCYQRASKLNSIDPFYEHQLNSLKHN